MAKLTTEQRREISADIQRRLSESRTPIPLTKANLASLVGLIDDQMEAAETAIIQTVPTGTARQWLVNNANLSRRFIETVEAKRRETL
jgi:hypothetical protein